jgi:hypothetical protein
MGDFRPIITDTDIVTDAVERSFEILARQAAATTAVFGQEKLKADLADAFIECADGYEMAKHLERCGWQGMDAAGVTALGAARTVLESAHRRAVRAWVQRVGLRPGHQLGDEVDFVLGARLWKGKIIEIFEQEGCYLVFSTALNAETKPSRSPLLPWEQVDHLSPATQSNN